MVKEFPAHIRMDEDGRETVQTCEEHSKNVAGYATKILTPVGLAAVGKLTGLTHDAGKPTEAFKAYIEKAAHGEPVRRGSVNHTFAGVRAVMEQHTPDAPPGQKAACELIAAAIGAHHGLFDIFDSDGRDGFSYREEKEGIDYERAMENFFSSCIPKEAWLTLLHRASGEAAAAVARCVEIGNSEQEETLFCLSLLERLLLSAVIEGDRRDTAEFMGKTVFPEYPEDMRPLWKERLAFMERKLNDYSAQSAVNRARRAISDHCRAYEMERGGIYRLCVPTGSGKTLASLRFALAAAARHNKRRMVFVTPLLSVLDQNAVVIHENLGDDRLILEHHSNVVRPERADDRKTEYELLCETWNAPVILTTLVQLLDTLFSGKPTCIRRMHALIDSVIVIDEVQSVPPKMLSLFHTAINFLAGFCHATVLLCSATLPADEYAAHALRPKAREVVPYDAALWQPFQRTQIVDSRRDGGYTAEKLAAFAQNLLAQNRSVLLICNTKAEARAVYLALQGAPAEVYHLSTSLCMQHRLDVLKEVMAELGDKTRRVICVATQLVEAGVDFSFTTVIRVCAGLDNAVQSAGRCNRNRESETLGRVYLVNFHGEDLSRLPEIRQSQIACEDLLLCYGRDRQAFGGDLTGEAAIRHYYRQLYTGMRQENKTAMDFPVKKLRTNLYSLLSDNDLFGQKNRTYQKGAYLFNQAFETAGKYFQVFSQDTTDVIVPHGGGESLIADLCGERAQRDLAFCAACLAKAKPYTVSLYQYQVDQLFAAEALYPLCDKTVLVLKPGFYHEKLGILTGKIEIQEVPNGSSQFCDV